MRKKNYLKPTMQVVKLEHQAHLLQASGVQSTRPGYGEAQIEDWE